MGNKAMTAVEELRKRAHMSKTEISGGSPQRYYEHLKANSVKTDVVSEYLRRLGGRLIIKTDDNWEKEI